MMLHYAMPKKKTEQERFNQKYQIDTVTGCWNWTATKHVKGYGFFGSESGKMEGAHRTSHRLFIGPIPKGKHVLHTCDNPSCVNPDHLRVGTNSDNMQDRNEKGRGCFPGDAEHPQTRLDPEKVFYIRSKFRSDPSWTNVLQLAEKFNVDPTTIRKAATGKTWKHLATRRRKR